nr:ABC transporter ATP-binding protein [Pullulanibacillus pueri]
MIDISKSYDKQTNVLNDINLSINKGEFFVLVGPSGCGKSTLLRMVAGLEEITSGLLTINGEPANHLPPKERKLSMVFQNYALYPHLTVEQNILFGLDVKKVNKEERKRRLKETAEMIGLTDLLKRKPKELSGGQRQRVALARSVVSRAPLCLMDEPLSNLDAKLRAQMRIEIRRLQRQLGLTMIYVTHDQVEAMTMGDRIMVLNEGKVQQVGKPITLYNEPANTFVASFIGSPKMNLGQAELLAEGKQLIVEDKLQFQLSAQDRIHLPPHQKTTIGIRAEHLYPAANHEATHHLEVAGVEHLGNETLIVFEGIGDQLWSAKWSGQWMVSPGDVVPVSISVENFCFFDAENGRLIKPAYKGQSQEVVAQ